MSRVGRSPIAVPSNVTVTLSGATVNVKGPQGSLERQLPEGITVAQEGETLVVGHEALRLAGVLEECRGPLGRFGARGGALFGVHAARAWRALPMRSAKFPE